MNRVPGGIHSFSCQDVLYLISIGKESPKDLKSVLRYDILGSWKGLWAKLHWVCQQFTLWKEDLNYSEHIYTNCDAPSRTFTFSK